MSNGHLYVFKGLYEKHFSLKRYLDGQRAFSRMGGDEIIGRIKAELPKSPYYSTEESWYRESGNAAFIPVEGLLTNEVDVFEMLYFGAKQTSYKAIVDSLAKAKANPAIETAYLEINSGGGYSEGMYDVLEAIRDFGKKTVAVVGDFCCSAAYGIASQCDQIIAKNNGSTFGSIGVAASFSDWSGFYEKMGVKEFTLTNDESTDKRPDMKTEHGRSVYVEWLNADFEVFFEYIQTGRSKNSAFSAEGVKNLRGKVVTAKKAVALGLADMIQKNYIESNSVSVGSASSANIEKQTNRGVEMKDLKALCAEDESLQTQLDSMLAEASKSAMPDSQALAVAAETARKAENERMMSIITKSGAQMSAVVVDALSTRKTLADYAIAMLDVHGKTAQANFGSVPGIQAPNPQAEASFANDETAKLNAYLSNI